MGAMSPFLPFISEEGFPKPNIESSHLLNIVLLQFRLLADRKDLGLRKASVGNFKVGLELGSK